MPFPGHLICDFPPIWTDLGDSLGLYKVELGLEPLILLNSKLEGNDLTIAQGVYNTLFSFHERLNDSYKLYPLKVYYEDLVPVEALPRPEVGPEIVFIGRAFRLWRFIPDIERIRVVGRAS